MPTVLVARTDALSATLLTSDIDEAGRRLRDGRADERGLLPGERRPGGGDRAVAGLRAVRGRPLVRDVDARPAARRASSRRRSTSGHPRKLLAYNCSPSFNWRKALSDEEIAGFQQQLGEWGYRFQFITLAGFHSLNAGMFELARGYRERGMSAYVELQEREFSLEPDGLHGHQASARGRCGILRQGDAGSVEGLGSTLALHGSTEEAQFA